MSRARYLRNFWASLCHRYQSCPQPASTQHVAPRDARHKIGIAENIEVVNKLTAKQGSLEGHWKKPCCWRARFDRRSVDVMLANGAVMSSVVDLQLGNRFMLSRIQIAKIQTVHNSESRRIGGAGTGLGWWESGKQLGEKTLVTAGIYRPKIF